MFGFKELYYAIDQTQSTNEKVEILQSYFRNAESAEAAWTLFILMGGRLKRTISSRNLIGWALEYLQLPGWLFAECYASVGDTAETISLLIPHQESKGSLYIAQIMEQQILPLANASEEEKQALVLSFWQKQDRESCFIFNKLLTGALRVGVSRQLTLRALSQALEVPQEKLAQLLHNKLLPSAAYYEGLKSLEALENLADQPFPFYLASPLDKELAELGAANEWFAEWKWDGIRAQLIRGADGISIWSRGNEMISHQCPELIEMAMEIPFRAILDGEILAFKESAPMPFFALQKRLGRKNPSKKIREEVPLVFMAYDLLALQGEDLRERPFIERRTQLEKLIHEMNNQSLRLSPTVEFLEWQDILKHWEQAKERGVEGLMLKKRSSPYKTGRVRGNWWKFKVNPMTIDAVLLYAQPGSGRRANLYTDFTFAVWHEGILVPIVKAYSGLDQEEIAELDKWIRRHTVEKFGPVRQVEPCHVFEIAFENAQPSTRHKAGIALRFPRIQRWRHDKTADQADYLEAIKQQIFGVQNG